MIRHTQTAPVPGAQKIDENQRGEQPAPARSLRSRRSRRVTAVIASAALLLAAVAAYLVTLAPDHYAAAQAERLSGDSVVEVSGVAQVVPGAGWIAQPRVTSLVAWPPLPAVRDWRVLTGADTGVELLSPDRGLSVELVATPGGADADAGADSGGAGGAGGAAATWLGEGASDSAAHDTAAVLNETLASGAQLQHVDATGEVRAVVTVDGQRVRVLARITGQPGAASDKIADYRPALSELLESLRVG